MRLDFKTIASLKEMQLSKKERLALGDSICSLVGQTREGCSQSREALLVHLRAYISLIAKTGMNRTFQAKFGESDVVQQSIIAASEKFDQFRGQTEEDGHGWVRQILKMEFLQNQRALRAEKRDLFRERSIPSDQDDPSRRLNLPLFDNQLTPGTDALQKEQAELVTLAMEQLPEEYREVIRLRNWEKKSFPEIGEVMNRSANAVTKLWYRALIQLRRLLDERNE